MYETFNVLLRRNPKENNFKAILETIRDLMNTNCVVRYFPLFTCMWLGSCSLVCLLAQVPDWLHDVFLGFGDPGAAHYSTLKSHVSAARLFFINTSNRK